MLASVSRILTEKDETIFGDILQKKLLKAEIGPVKQFVKEIPVGGRTADCMAKLQIRDWKAKAPNKANSKKLVK